MESARIIAALTRITHDVGAAEECAQDALVAALEQWPREGVPDNPGAWLTTAARRRALDRLRREQRLDLRHEQAARDAERRSGDGEPDPDDVLRLLFVTCHPVLPEAQRVALTLRLVAGLTAAEIARALLTGEQGVVRLVASARRTLAENGVGFELPAGAELAERLSSVLGVVYLVFNEGYTATSGEDLLRPGLCLEALRLGRTLAQLVPDDPEVHGLVALMELQQSRAGARTGPGGELLPLHEQNRGRWDPLLVRRGFASMLRARGASGPPGPYVLQAAIAVCHARARSEEETDWTQIAALYDLLAVRLPTPVVRLNRAVAVGRARGPAEALELVDELVADPALRDYHLLPGVRGDLLLRLERREEARRDFERAAALTGNAAERAFLLRRAEAAAGAGTGPALGERTRAFLAGSGLGAATVRSYRQTLERLCRSLGEGLPLADLTAEHVEGVFTAAWSGAAPRTWNRHRAAVRSFGTWAGLEGLDAGLERRAEPVRADRGTAPALPARLWEDTATSPRERALWRLLHESGAPVSAVLGLNVEDLDLRARRTFPGAVPVAWGPETARLLPALVEGRTRGPLFLSDRRPGPARTPAPQDLCPETGRRRLSYERAEYLFKQATRSLDPDGEGHTLGCLRRRPGISPAARPAE
nr:sigma-70 family RNA polymerase sigma factor [Nocardiopsis algeriensis]